jgi:hypothetical protein
MKIINLLEGATDVLYHYTNLHAAADVFAADAFKLSTSLGTPAELDLQPKGYPYYLSTTRSKTGSFHRHVGKNAVMFVLDGQWFQQRYKVKPVDYWAGMNSDRKEAEDRVYSKDSEIPLGGVRAVHILFRNSDSTESSLLRKILISSKKQGIATYVYAEETAWRLQDRRKALDTEAVVSAAQGKIDPEYRAWTSKRQAQQTQEEPSGVAVWNELLRTPASQYDKLSKNAQTIAYDFRYGREYYWSSRVESLKTDIHNSKGQRAGFEYPDVVKLIKTMKALDLKNIDDLISYLREKWKLKESQADKITTESLDNPYPIEVKPNNYSARNYKAEAELSDGTMLDIYFHSFNGKMYHVDFWRDDSQKVTGAGDQQRIFATVLSAINQFITKVKPKQLQFSAYKQKVAGDNFQTNPMSRAYLYNRMVKKYAESAGYNASQREEADLVSYTLTKKEDANLNEVQIDNHKGWGEVPLNRSVDYHGLRVLMPPSVFLKLAAPDPHGYSAKDIEQHIKSGGAIASPFLEISIPNEWEDGNVSKLARIVSHEGRNRMKAIKAIEGDDPIEVHLFIRGGIRRRHITDEWIKSMQSGMYSEGTQSLIPGPLFTTF